MTSTIKVDTISEKTSANGVAIDGLTLKDGNVGAAGTATSVAGIPFYRNDTSSIYTHDVSGTDDTAALNTAYGITALDAITTGDNNTVVGSGAGSALNTGHRNTLMGQGAGGLLTTATHTVAIGNAAASGYDTETHNLAIGHIALGGSVAGGEYNVAIGSFTLDALTSADYNVAVGYQAGTAVTTGGNSVYVGRQAGLGTTTGYDNTFVGAEAGVTNDDGHSNTALGKEAGYHLSSGDNNTLLGRGAGLSASPSGQIDTEDNRVCIGNNSVTNASIKVDWTVTSDKRDKTDVEPLKMSLDFINKLNPVTYRWDMRSDYDNQTPNGTHKKPQLLAGFLAQDVEAIERTYGYKVENKTAVLTNVQKNGDYGLTYAKFIPVLINAVKELSAKVKTLEEA